MMNNLPGPKYMVLKTIIKDWALEGKIRPGGQIPTEAQLAEQFNLSRQTVRQAINDLVHENVLYRRQGKGTFLAESFMNREAENVSHSIIAVITTYISDYIFPSIVRGIESRLSDARYSMLLLNTNNNFEKEAKAIASVLERPIDGVIVEPTKSSLWNPNLQRYLHLLSKQIPIVMLHSSYIELGAPCVRMDDEKGGFLAALHLLQLGHRCVGGIFKSDDSQGRARLRGFVTAHNDEALPPRQEWIRFYSTEEMEHTAQRYVESWLQADEAVRPTAVVCYNDEIAADLYSHLASAKIRVPDDISVVSFDDSAWAQAQRCTTIKHPKYEMGLQAADYILKRIEGVHQNRSNSISDYVFEPELIIRSSTKAPTK